jgi:hypothetical protein
MWRIFAFVYPLRRGEQLVSGLGSVGWDARCRLGVERSCGLGISLSMVPSRAPQCSSYSAMAVGVARALDAASWGSSLPLPR